MVNVEARTWSLIAALLQPEVSSHLHEIHITRMRIRTGLEASAVERLVVRYRDSKDRSRQYRLIAKRLEGRTVREATVYRELIPKAGIPIAPAVLYVEESSPDCTVLLLEDVHPVDTWPWRNVSAAQAVLQRLAHFHERARNANCSPPEWDYRTDLERSAISTVEQLGAMRTVPEFASMVRRSKRAVERLASSLPGRHAELLRFQPFGSCPIHGDLHPGNVLLRRCASKHEPVLIDWARTRIGSRLEDVSSWLQSLGYWEPEAGRKHDTLLATYLSAAGYSARLSSDVRAAYWTAAACNALAGALRYYCWKATTASSLKQRADAARTAHDWVRIITRADALSG